MLLPSLPLLFIGSSTTARVVTGDTFAAKTPPLAWCACDGWRSGLPAGRK